MKDRFRIICYHSRGGIYYLHDNGTKQRESLHTTDPRRANELMVAYNEAARDPAFNLQKARIYLNAADPKAATRTWGDALEAVIASKPEDSEVRLRWERFEKDEALEEIVDVVLLETRAEQVLKAASAKTVSTNVFMRRLHNHCVGMGWLPWPVLPPKLWPKIKFKKKRAIKYVEHLRIIAREKNLERRNFYDLSWYFSGSRSDIAISILRLRLPALLTGNFAGLLAGKFRTELLVMASPGIREKHFFAAKASAPALF